MTPEQLWAAYTSANPQYSDASYDAWQYGSSDPDALLSLTECGVKTATASAYPSYVHENCPLPKVGGHSVLLDSRGNARCIIRTVRVNIVPFEQVRDEQAFLEGEGDRTLSYWRRVHAAVFTAELTEIGQTFTQQMPVVCEIFERVWP